MKSFLPVLLRLTSFGVKFSFIFLVAFFLKPEAVAIYGFVTAISIFCSYILALELAKIYVREICEGLWGEPKRLLKNIFVAASSSLIAISIPLWFLLEAVQLSSYWLLIIGIITLDSLSQETYKILIGKQELLKASVFLFVKQAIWPLVSVILLYFYPHLREIETVLIVWLFLSGASYLMSFIFLKVRFIDFLVVPLDRRWLLISVKLALPFVAIALTTRAITTGDRFLLAMYLPLDQVGAYIFYFSISAVSLALLDVGIFSVTTPQLLKFRASGLLRECLRLFRKVCLISISFLAFYLACVYLLTYFFIDIFANGAYANYMGILPFVFLFTFVHVINQLLFILLYVFGADKVLLKSNVLSVILFAIAVFGMSVLWSVSLVGMIVCLVAGAFVSVIYRLFSAQRLFAKANVVA